MTETADTVQVALAVGGLKETLHVLRAEGLEELSRLYSFEVLVAAKSADLDLDAPVGQAAVLTLEGQRGERYIHGMVRRFEETDSGRNVAMYRVEIVPRAWRLLQRRDCRIFQGKTTQQIVGEVLRPARVDVAFKLRGSPKPREYCVQYRESDWAFVSRLMAEEGMFYFFEHHADKHVLVVGNDAQVHPSIAGGESLLFHKPDAMVPGQEQVTGFSQGVEVTSGQVVLADYSFETPSTDLSAKKADKLDRDLELYDYPGMFEAGAAGRELAQLRLEEARATGRRGGGQSNCPALTSGHVFSLSGHHRKDVDGKRLLITRVHHRVEKTGQDLEGGALNSNCSYDNTFGCMPRNVPFRPPRLVPRPVVRGPQTAVVVGPDKEEIYTDKHGRVKVQFHWDRQGKWTDQSSCWMRVAQAWAGPGFGSQFIPRVGMEVVVDFLEGDPDRPLVTGCVYHAQNVTPLVLPSDKTKSTIRSSSSPGGKGFNELTLEDRAGAEEIYLHAQRDLREKVRRHRTTSVNGSQTLSVGYDRHKTVGHDEKVKIKGDVEVEIEGKKGISIDKDLEVTIKGEHSEETTKGYGVEAKTVTFKAADSIVLRCGKAKIKLDKSGDIDIAGSGIIKLGGQFIKLN